MKKGKNMGFLIKGLLKMKPKHYYDQKYSYTYPVFRWDGFWVFCTLPVKDLVKIYEKEIGSKPTSFFDCGCATGELLRQAESMNMRVQGIDIKKYPSLFKPPHPNIEIVSILNYKKSINYDIVFLNGTLTYLNEKEVDTALQKFKNAKLVIAIHNTIEDDEKAGGTEYRDPKPNKPRLIKRQNWWVQKFKENGFNARYDSKTDCFLATPKIKE